MRVAIHGHVQGVGFRWFVREQAEKMQVCGWVRNQPNGDVELEVQGAEDVMKKFLSALKTGHPFARVEKIESREIPVIDEQDFSIR